MGSRLTQTRSPLGWTEGHPAPAWHVEAPGVPPGPRRARPRSQPRPGGNPDVTAGNRRSGDRFRRRGRQADKRLKDFLIDRKIAAEVRDRLPLLIWNGEIVWVGGVEISERFKVTSPEEGERFEVVFQHDSRKDQERVQR